MEVTIISEELIKPSSSTPNHLRNFKLSLFDQKNTSSYAPVILFYSQGNTESGVPSSVQLPQKLDILKKSLAHTLARLYPLAGKILDDLSIDCDDKGARFVEASVNRTLTQFLDDPNTDLFLDLFPIKWGGSPMTRVTNVQVNLFECRGIAIALSISHILCDGTALGVFLKDWVAAAKSGGGAPAEAAPGLDLAGELFPATDLWLRDLMTSNVLAKAKSGNCIAKRLLFSGAAIEALKARGASPSFEKTPTRVEAVSGFLWKCLMAAVSRKRNDGQKRPSSFSHVVNIRRRMNPPLPDSCLGDLTWMATSHFENSDSISDRPNDELPMLVGELRGAISKVDGDFLSQLNHDRDLVTRSIEEMCGVVRSSSNKEEVDTFFCSSWCRFGFYDADFGWGRPIWVSTASARSSLFFNFILLMDTKFGGGIEAWVMIDEQEMAFLEEDGELLAIAAVNPSPLKDMACS